MDPNCYIAAEALRWRPDHVIPAGAPVPREEGRNYRTLLRIGKIRPASPPEIEAIGRDAWDVPRSFPAPARPVAQENRDPAPPGSEVPISEVATPAQIGALAAIGISTTLQLAESTPENVAEARRIGPKTAERLIEAAQDAIADALGEPDPDADPDADADEDPDAGAGEAAETPVSEIATARQTAALEAVGIHTVGALANAEPREVEGAAGIGPALAQRLQERASDYLLGAQEPDDQDDEGADDAE